MRILVINSSNSGHHLEYKAMLNKAFLELGHEVFNLMQGNIQQKQSDFSVSALKKEGRFFLRAYLTLISKHWKNRCKTLISFQQINNNIRQLEKESKRPDLIFFACLDAYINQNLTKLDINKKLKIPFSGILFYPRVTSLMTWSCFRRGLFDPYLLLKSKWCKSVGVLAEDAIPAFSSLISKPVFALPDIVSVPNSEQDNSLGELILKLARGRFIIGFFGSLELRKGLSEFLQMVLKLPNNNYFFVIGGQLQFKTYNEEDKFILQRGISGNIENLFIINRWLTDEELFSGLNVCNLITAAYRNWQYSSGIVGKAASVHVPILVNDGYVMAKRVKDFKIGFIKNEETKVSTWVLDNTEAIKHLKKSDCFKRGCTEYCKQFGYDQWCKSLSYLLAKTINQNNPKINNQ
jgi:glycosyltransferase involved in cell wall biosynthesis